MNIQKQLIFWLCLLAVMLLTLWTLGSVLLPFILGMTIAYLLNPVVIKLEGYGLSRLLATVFILLSFFLVLATFLLFALPALYQQSLQLADALPEFLDKVWLKLQPFIIKSQEFMDQNDVETNLLATLKDSSSEAVSFSTNILSGLLSGGQAILGFFSVLLITPLVAFFVMLNWPKMVIWVDQLIPRHSYESISGLLKKIDRVLSGFVRGQLTVAFILGSIYALALTFAGLDYGFIIGFIAGILSVVPYLGSIFGFLTSIIVAWLQTGEPGYIAIIAAIFLAGQFLEGNFISPKILGDSVGLHPLWILFAIIIGGSLFGITGMIIGVPIAASIGVLLGFGIAQYKRSKYYNAENTPD